MSSIKAFIRTKVSDKIVNIRFRISHGEGIQLFYTSSIVVRADAFDATKEQIKSNTNWICDRVKINRDIFDTKQKIEQLISKMSKSTLQSINSESLTAILDNKDVEQKAAPSIHDRIKEYCILKRLSIGRANHFTSVSEMLRRFEKLHEFVIMEDMICYELMLRIDTHIRTEHELYKEHPHIWPSNVRKPKLRSENTIASIMNIVRTICNYLFECGYITDRSYSKYKVSVEVYGTPYYLTTEELKKIRKADLSKRPALDCQRDIFLFQCLVGCRVSDMMQFTIHNVIDNRFLEYVQSKGNRRIGDTVRVPLTSVAISLIEKHKTTKTTQLFPYIEPQKYNVSIKNILTIAKVTRVVTVLDPRTRKEKQVAINEIASSHLARRTFTGLVYKNVKDPNIVGKMTGHAEGSRAIARYRTIDDDIKRDAISALDILK